jgi:3-oxoacyl-[acyl-carrier protein] reductase
VGNFSSSALDAERVLEAIYKSGGKAMAEHCERGRTGKVGPGNEEGIRPDRYPRQQRGYVIGALTDITAADFHRHFDFNVLGLLLGPVLN